MSQTSSPSGRAPSGRPGRYQRSFGGLVAAMIVMVLVVVGFVIFRGAFRDNDFDPAAEVDYLETVGIAQRGGMTLVYPPSLPAGWEATSVDITPGTERTEWSLGILTDEDRFVGVQQGPSLDDLVELWFDEDAEEGAEVTLDSDLASRWTPISDDGGETGFATELDDGTVVLAHGSAPEDDVRALAESLTTRRLPAR